MFLARTSLAFQQTVLPPGAAVARPVMLGWVREVTGWWWQASATVLSSSGSVCGHHRVHAWRPQRGPAPRYCGTCALTCHCSLILLHPAGWGAALAPWGCWGVCWLPRRVKEPECVRQYCRNALGTWLLVTRENRKVRKVIKALCEKRAFTPNLGHYSSFFFPCRPDRGAHLLFIHCHPTFCTTLHTFCNT